MKIIFYILVLLILFSTLFFYKPKNSLVYKKVSLLNPYSLTSLNYPSFIESQKNLETETKKKNILQLIEILKSHKDVELRQNAALALGELGKNEKEIVVPVLLQYLNDSDLTISDNTAYALSQFELDTPAILYLSGLLHNHIGNSDKFFPHNSIAWLLGKVGKNSKEAVSALAESVNSPIHSTRIDSIRALTEIGKNSKGAIPSLLKCLEHQEFYTVIYAADAILTLDLNPEYFDSLVTALLRGLNRNPKSDIHLSIINTSAIRSLSKMPSKANLILPQILPFHNDTDFLVRIEVIKAIGCFAQESKDTKLIPILTKALKDQDWGVRSDAAISLGKYGLKAKKEALPFLLDIFKNKEEFEENTSLTSIKEEMTEEEHNEFRGVLDALVWALGEMKSEEALPFLKEILKNTNNKHLKYTTAGAILKISRQEEEKIQGILEQGILELLSLLKHDIWEIRFTAIRTLGYIGSPSKIALPHLLRFLEEPLLNDKGYNMNEIVYESLERINKENL
jgi:HEAT repeat protein